MNKYIEVIQSKLTPEQTQAVVEASSFVVKEIGVVGLLAMVSAILENSGEASLATTGKVDPMFIYSSAVLLKAADEITREGARKYKDT